MPYSNQKTAGHCRHIISAEPVQSRAEVVRHTFALRWRMGKRLDASLIRLSYRLQRRLGFRRASHLIRVHFQLTDVDHWQGYGPTNPEIVDRCCTAASEIRQFAGLSVCHGSAPSPAQGQLAPRRHTRRGFSGVPNRRRRVSSIQRRPRCPAAPLPRAITWHGADQQALP